MKKVKVKFCIWQFKRLFYIDTESRAYDMFLISVNLSREASDAGEFHLKTKSRDVRSKNDEK